MTKDSYDFVETQRQHGDVITLTCRHCSVTIVIHATRIGRTKTSTTRRKFVEEHIKCKRRSKG